MKGIQEKLKDWWSSISYREQHLIVIVSVMFALGSLYWGFILPFQIAGDKAHKNLIEEKLLLEWVQNRASELSELRAKNGVSSIGSGPLNQIISTTANRYKISLIRVQPKGDTGLQVWIEPAAFNELLEWMFVLKAQYGISVEFFDVDKTDRPGAVQVKRLQFSRG